MDSIVRTNNSSGTGVHFECGHCLFIHWSMSCEKSFFKHHSIYGKLECKRLNLSWENDRTPKNLYWQAQDLLGGRQIRKHPTVEKLRVETPSGIGVFAIWFRQCLALILLKWAALSQYEMLCRNNEVSYQFCFHYKTFVMWNQKGHLICICERLSKSLR